MTDRLHNVMTDANQATRFKLMEAAMRCVKERGMEKTSLNDIAKEAGCARQTVYNHFSNKDEVIYAALQEAAKSFAQQLLHCISLQKTVEDRITEGLIFCIRTLPTDTYLQLIADPNFASLINPEVFLSPVGLAMMRECAEACLFGSPELLPYLNEISETITRIALSLLTTENKMPRSDDELRAYIKRRFIPGLLAVY